jgi:hypothetical protein
MTDTEIENYLNQNNWSVIPNNFIHDVMNSSQKVSIIDCDYKTNLITIKTPTKLFNFRLDVKELYQEELNEE